MSGLTTSWLSETSQQNAFYLPKTFVIYESLILNEIIDCLFISDLQIHKVSCASSYFFICSFIVK